jgi:hypothetical protein
MDRNQRELIEWMANHLEVRQLQKLTAAVDAVFAALDLTALTEAVVRDRQVGFIAAATALDDVFGDVHHPYADDDAD